MKLYSRGQTLLIAVMSSALAGMLVLGFALFILKPSRSAKGDGQGAGGARPRLAGDQSGQCDQARDLSSQYAEGMALQQVDTNPTGYTQDEDQNIRVYAKANEAVVNITTEVMGVNWFMEPVPMDGGTGSGSIIDARGYVLTNYHVVKNAYKVFLNFADGDRLEGQVRGTDQENDLAVVSFDPPAGKRLSTIPYGDSSGLRVGQKVLAIGNPFGLDRTLTTGIVSALGRPVAQSSNIVIRDMIQTDAAINPGNSGGPLLNGRGEMIGINTMIYSGSGGSVGIGFAVPVNTAIRVVPDLIKYGSVKRGWIDITPVQLSSNLVSAMKSNGYKLASEQGILVSEVKRGSNADRAGIRGGREAVRYGRSVFNVGGDVIIAVDGMKVSSYADFLSSLEDNKPGDEVVVVFMREGVKMEKKVLLSDRSEKANLSQ